MSLAPIDALHDREPALLGQTVVVIGGSAGIGFETARRARAEGANIILTGRSTERLQQASSELGALSTAAFDANDPALLESFFRDLPAPIDHVMLTGPGPRYWALQEIEFEQARLALSEHLLLAFWVARNAAPASAKLGERGFSATGPIHPPGCSNAMLDRSMSPSLPLSAPPPDQPWVRCGRHPVGPPRRPGEQRGQERRRTDRSGLRRGLDRRP